MKEFLSNSKLTIILLLDTIVILFLAFNKYQNSYNKQIIQYVDEWETLFFESETINSNSEVQPVRMVII